MFNKMNVTAMTVLALSMCSVSGYAQSDWNDSKQLQYRSMKTLNACEQYDLNMMLRHMPGSFEGVFAKAINKASDDNGAMLTGSSTTSTMTTGTNNERMTWGTSGWRNQMMMNEGTDWDAYRKLLNSVSGSERALIEQKWPTLSGREQDAILHVIKRSWMVMPPTDMDMKSMGWMH